MDRFSRYAILVALALGLGATVPRALLAAEDESEEMDYPTSARRPRIALPVPDQAELHSKVPEMRWVAEQIAAGSTDPRVLRAYQRLSEQLFPYDVVPPRDLKARALAQKKALEARAAASLVPMATGCWFSLGPINIPGRMTAIAADPSDTNIVYVGGADGGIWKTSDNGGTWLPVTDFNSSLAVGALTIDPRDPNILYAGLGEGNYAQDNLFGPGVLKSTDAGATWTENTIAANFFHEIHVDPFDSSRVWGATTEGLFVSTDAGQTWSLIGGGLPIQDTTSFTASAKPGSQVLLATIGSGRFSLPESGLYRSPDAGASWALVPGLPAGGDTGRGVISQSPGNPDRIYVAFHNNLDDQLLGIWRSDDEGATWMQMTTPSVTALNLCNGQCWYNFHMTTDAADPDLVYLAGFRVLRSRDGGVTWARVTGGIHVDQHFAYSPAPNQLIEANDGGLYRSPDQGATWQNLGFKLVTGQYYHITNDPFDDTRTVGGTQDNGTHRYAGTTSFDQVQGGDGMWTAIDWVNPGVWYASYYSLAMTRSRDGGNSFVDIGAGIDANEYRLFVAPFSLDRSNPSTVFAGTTKLYKSTDQGDNFVAISPDLTPNITNRAIRSIDNCRDAPSNIWAGTSDGHVWKTPDGGTNWIEVTGTLPVRQITSIAIHPSDPNLVYITLSGTGTGHVFKTTDGGANWIDLSAGLPDITARHILLIPEQPQTLILAMDLGIYRSDDGAQTWNVYGTQLPNVAADWLGYTPSTGTLRIGTHGRGIWQLVPQDSCPLAPAFAGLDSITTAPVGAPVTCQPHLTWQSGQPGCTIAPFLRYNVYRSTDPLFVPGPTTLLQAGIPGTSYTDSTAAANTPYYYVVKAEDSQTSSTGPANGGVEDLNSRVLWFEVGNPITAGAFRDSGGDGNAWMKSRYWSVDNTANTTPAGQYTYHSAPRLVAYDADLCEAIETPDMVIGAGATLTYQGSYNIEFEWDGVVVESSTDGGQSWTDLPPNGGYPSSLAQTQGNGCAYPATQAAFNGPTTNGAPTPFQLYTHDLASLSGQTARFRWELTSDAAAQFEGFRLDDIVITPVSVPTTGGGCSCTGPAAPPVTANSLRAVRLAGSGNRFSWLSANPPGAWNLHMTGDKTQIPGLAGNQGSIAVLLVAATEADDPGTFPPGFYQVYGANCAGISVP